MINDFTFKSLKREYVFSQLKVRPFRTKTAKDGLSAFNFSIEFSRIEQ
jgi:hypothetical protein